METTEQTKANKRMRTESSMPPTSPAQYCRAGREKLLVCSAYQKLLGKKYCDEVELLAFLLAHGMVRRVQTIEIEVRPLGGENFSVTLDAGLPLVGEVKAEIARVQGTPCERQDLYKVSLVAGGCAVREDDADPEPLENDLEALLHGETVTMVVRESLTWQTFPEDTVQISEGGTVATMKGNSATSMGTSMVQLTQGLHWWEVELLSAKVGNIVVGICTPNLGTEGMYHKGKDCADGWFVSAMSGALFGNGKYGEDRAAVFEQGDRVGVLLDLDEGSLQFYKNGEKHGAGYPAGSVAGPVLPAVQMRWRNQSVKILGGTKPPQVPAKLEAWW
jgi:hypothetical protein